MKKRLNILWFSLEMIVTATRGGGEIIPTGS
jgi:hypothetical protein